MGAMRDFLKSETGPTEEMAQEDMAAIIEGYRAVVSLIPDNVMEFLLRIGEPFRLLSRKYEPHTGVLANVKFEVSEYQLHLIEPAFDNIRGVRTIEEKTITIPEEMVAYYEDVDWRQDYEEWIDEQNLAQQSLEG